MVLKLYGFPLSVATRRVALVLHEKNIPYDFIPVDLSKGEHKLPDYVAKHPFGQVPYLDDGGLILFESRAIARYIEAKFPDKGPRLIPPISDLAKYALFEQAVSIEQTDFDYFVSGACAEKIFKPARGQKASSEFGDILLETLDKKLDVYEKILSKQKYIAGDEFTLADLFHIPYGSLLPRVEFTVLETGAGGRTNVARWWKDITSRPSWQALKERVPEGGLKA